MGKNIFPTLNEVTEKMQNSTWPSVGQNFRGENAAYEAYELTGLYAYDGPMYNEKNLASFWDVGTTITFTPDDTYVAFHYAHDSLNSNYGQYSAWIVYKRDLLGNFNYYKPYYTLNNSAYAHKFLFSDEGKYLFISYPQYNQNRGLISAAIDNQNYAAYGYVYNATWYYSLINENQNCWLGKFLEKLPFNGVITSCQFTNVLDTDGNEDFITRTNYLGRPKDLIIWWQDNHTPGNYWVYDGFPAFLPQEISLLSLATFSINSDSYFVTSHADRLTIYRVEDFWSYCGLAYGSQIYTNSLNNFPVLVGNHSEYIPTVNTAYFGARIAAAYNGAALAFVSYSETVSAAMLSDTSQYLGEVSVAFSYTKDGIFDFSLLTVISHPFQGQPSQAGVNRSQYANFGDHERFGIMFSDDGEVLVITDDINIYIYAVVYASRSIILRKIIKHKGIDYLQNVYLHPNTNDLYITESEDPIGGRTFFENTYVIGQRFHKPNNTVTIYPAKGN